MDTLTTYALDAGLAALPPHLSTLLASLAFFTFVHLVVAPLASHAFFPDTYGKMGRRARNNWFVAFLGLCSLFMRGRRCIHVVSQAHVSLVIPLALGCLNLEALDRDRAFGWEEDKVGRLIAVSSGYFIWDTVDAIVNFVDIGFVVHGLACLAIYLGSFKPFLAYYAARCLLWEASTFFLNIHWFLDKTNRTGSNFQFINGLFLLITFFVVRLVYGGMYVSYQFAHTLYQVRHQVPLAYIFIYGGGNVVLQGLNWLWFGKMIEAIRKRFSGDTTVKARTSNGTASK
ncbi:TLC domain-containing protein [Armillaria nabsnona]|nr:TLC domain-containing protein [Armillaria nabsnona]